MPESINVHMCMRMRIVEYLQQLQLLDVNINPLNLDQHILLCLTKDCYYNKVRHHAWVDTTHLLQSFL